MAKKIIDKKGLDRLAAAGIRNIFPGSVKIAVQMGTCGRASGAEALYEVFQEEQKAVLGQTGCIGLCQREPMVNVFVPGFHPVVYADLTPERARELVPAWINGEAPVGNALMQLTNEEFRVNGQELRKFPGVPEYSDVPFFGRQRKIALRNSGFIDRTSLAEYIARGGYYALLEILSRRQSDDIVEEILISGLRGRGGGGYLTGRKWKACRAAHGSPKYVICNADEGDPGAYMDRTVIEGDPFSVLEGMAIGAYAIGSNHGYIYVRAEYPLAVATLRAAIKEARVRGLLGENILGSSFSFDITICRGGGAYVCGESTALMSSIEGKVGEPRLKHIHTIEAGLREKPTVLNNVETWANVPFIMTVGGETFRKIGTERSTGTKVFSLVGNVTNTGLVEIPMGIALREIIYDIGGGVPGGKRFKAVQTGGPSGGCIPETLLDLPVDFDELTKVGSMMGSGGMIVMDEATCMVDVARYFLSFLVEESCGKCTPCREGTYQLLQIVTRITDGAGTEQDLEDLQGLSETIKDCSLCALGKTAPNPVLSTIRYFRNEYESHIREKKCPAGKCRALIAYRVITDRCTTCGVCFKKCPSNAIAWERKQVAEIVPERCTKCGICLESCKFDSIVRE